MAAEHPLIIAAAATNGLVQSSLLTAFIERMPYVLKRTEVLADLTQPSGMVARVVHSEQTGYAYYLNEADTTSADDGVTVLVDFDGRRYIVANAVDLNINSVLAIQATPPGSPAEGDAYIVAASPTGAWVGHAEDIAIYTPRGWLFARALVGLTVLNEDDGQNWQYDATATWALLVVTPLDGSIIPAHQLFEMGISVEAQQNAPPGGGPVDEIYYLVGTAGSGDFSGHNNELAYSRNSAWEFIAAYEGAQVYDKNTNALVRYNGSAWVNTAAGVLDYQTFTTSGAATWTKPSGVTASSMVFIQVWGGGGGSGGCAAAASGSGSGGGGAYIEAWIPASALGATESLNIGAAGTAGASGDNPGGAGGNSTFGSWLTAYGGGGGEGGAGGDNASGGGGGGGLSVGTVGSGNGATGGPGGSPNAGSASSHGGGTGATTSAAAGQSMWGGGGGGANVTNTTGGNSIYGGGGGGGGTSKFGGNGGAANTAGSAPGGGGGRRTTSSAAGFAGGRGEIRVTVFA